MRRLSSALAAVLLLYIPALPQGNGAPVEEKLSYTVNWPSGLSLGEALVQASKAAPRESEGERWELRFSLDAAIPGFSVADRFRSTATKDLCSVEFERETAHGSRAGRELTTFDLSSGTATRQTLTPAGGGKSQLSIPACPRDALAFVYFVRRELAQGRLPQTQTLFFGGAYQVRLEFGGRRQLQVGGEQVDADRITASVKGASSETSFEMFFAQDRTRRPVLVRVPLPLGAFTMELNP
jgi:hypothetical protein